MKKIIFTLMLTSFFFSRLNSQEIYKDKANDSFIADALTLVNADSLKATMVSLQDMGTRFMIAPNRKEVATWIMNRFISMGINEVRLDSFECHTNINFPFLQYDTTTWQYNVEAKITGNSSPDQEVVVLGHYDCVVDTDDPMFFAPGADDNASGTAAVLECARVINAMDYQPEQTFIFLTSAAEELLYFGDAGTEHYAIEAMEDGRDLVMVINNDMISWNNGTWTLALGNHLFSPHITELAIYIIENYTTLNYYASEPVIQVGADLQPFLFCGYHGIYFMEDDISPDYHHVTDLVANCDSSYLAEITKVNLGMILQSDITVGIRESVINSEKISIYPNPASDETYVMMDDPTEQSWDLKIADITCKVIYQSTINTGINRIDVSMLPGGMYTMIFSKGGEMQCRKLIKS